MVVSKQPSYKGQDPRLGACPVCGGGIPRGHRSGNGCSWCDHVGLCQRCADHERSPDRMLDCVQALNQGKIKR